jgi:hypothetical protein
MLEKKPGFFSETLGENKISLRNPVSYSMEVRSLLTNLFKQSLANELFDLDIHHQKMPQQ